jgi:hypothetical protein
MRHATYPHIGHSAHNYRSVEGGGFRAGGTQAVLLPLTPISATLLQDAQIARVSPSQQNVLRFQTDYNTAGGRLAVTGIMDAPTTEAVTSVIGSATAQGAAGVGRARVLMYATYPETVLIDQTERSDQFYRSVRPGLGADPTQDPAVQAAAGNLLAGLQNGTITARVNPIVRVFQKAWILAGGTLPATITSQNGTDGMYGAETQAVLQSVLDSVYGPGQAAVPGFTESQLTAANSGTGKQTAGSPGNPVNIDAYNPTTTTTTTTSTTTNYVPWAIGAALLAVGIAGTAVIHKKQHKPGASRKPLFHMRRRRSYARA